MDALRALSSGFGHVGPTDGCVGIGLHRATPRGQLRRSGAADARREWGGRRPPPGSSADDARSLQRRHLLSNPALLHRARAALAGKVLASLDHPSQAVLLATVANCPPDVFAALLAEGALLASLPSARLPNLNTPS